MKKKQWQKPQLVVLVRSKPEEAVLTACKAEGIAGAYYDAGLCSLYVDRCGMKCESPGNT